MDNIINIQNVDSNVYSEIRDSGETIWLMDIRYYVATSGGDTAVIDIPRIVLNTATVDSDIEYVFEGLSNKLYSNFAKRFSVEFEQDSKTQIYTDIEEI